MKQVLTIVFVACMTLDVCAFEDILRNKIQQRLRINKVHGNPQITMNIVPLERKQEESTTSYAGTFSSRKSQGDTQWQPPKKEENYSYQIIPERLLIPPSIPVQPSLFPSQSLHRVSRQISTEDFDCPEPVASADIKPLLGPMCPPPRPPPPPPPPPLPPPPPFHGDPEPVYVPPEALHSPYYHPIPIKPNVIPNKHRNTQNKKKKHNDDAEDYILLNETQSVSYPKEGGLEKNATLYTGTLRSTTVAEYNVESGDMAQETKQIMT